MPISNSINSPTIFTGGDTKFWNRFGKSFVKSFKHFNPDKTIHVHIFDPTDEDIRELDSLPCNYSIEYTTVDEIVEFVEIAKRSATPGTDYDDNHKWQIKKCMKYFDDIPNRDDKLLKLMKFTKFASTRFIRLSEMWSGHHPVLAYDMDTLCKGNIPFEKVFLNNDQVSLTSKGGERLVGLVGFKNNSLMLKEWGDLLTAAFSTKKIHGFLDQDTFISVCSTYNVTNVDRIYCDPTSKNGNSLVITAKGTMKESETFLNAVAEWNK